MGFAIGRRYSGFLLEAEDRIEEIDGTALRFLHEKSGARLLYLRREDDNRVFSITFKTPPSDSTGIPHIIEHSLLCGSRKFPSKEPFIELAKGSLNTFLNAMTFPDKTMYPVASRNARDLFNLMDVYLDAVFHPNIYRYPEIFMQEGWHHELEDKKAALTYRGVVYNEMKGVFSTPESVLFRKIPESLFPDTPYAFESGGDPDVIPDLTYEAFLDFHGNYYHPSNSFIFLYGDGDVEEHLRFLDESYLGEFDRIAVDGDIPLQPPFSTMRTLEAAYPLASGEGEDEKTFFSLNYAVGRAVDPLMTLAFTIIEYLLLENSASPLKNRLIEEEIGKDVFGQFERDIQQPVFSVVVKNSDGHKRARFQEIVRATLEELVRGGIDKRLVEASINIHEFRLREADYRGFPRGLAYNMAIMTTWLYGGDPLANLRYDPVLEEVKRALKEPRFEELIESHLLRNSHRSLVEVKPDRGLSDRKNAERTSRLQAYRGGLGGDEEERIIEETRRLRERQAAPDPPELIEKIPLLSISDIEREAERLPMEIDGGGVTVLSHPLFTSGISYVNLYFDTSPLTREELPYLSLLVRLLGRVDTKRRDYMDLAKEINIQTGGIGFGHEPFGDKDDDTNLAPHLVVKSKALAKKVPELFALLREITLESLYDGKRRIREIIQETKSRFEMNIYSQGHFVAAGRLLSYYSPRGHYGELTGGISFYHFIRELEKKFDGSFDEIAHTLKGVAEKVFSRHGMVASVTGESGDYGPFRDNLDRLVEVLPDLALERAEYAFQDERMNEGLLTPGDVQYVARGFNYRRLGHAYRGSLQVLRTIAGLDYLWNRVRVQGGAYGCVARFFRDGNMYFCSYRDPNLSETFSVYEGAGEYFRTYAASEREISKYIIGTVSRLDHPLTPSMKGEAADQRYLQNISHDDVQQTREEVLATTLKDIRDTADLIDDAIGRGYLCVLGSESKIRSESSRFKEMVEVFS